MNLYVTLYRISSLRTGPQLGFTCGRPYSCAIPNLTYKYTRTQVRRPFSKLGGFYYMYIVITKVLINRLTQNNLLQRESISQHIVQSTTYRYTITCTRRYINMAQNPQNLKHQSHRSEETEWLMSSIDKRGLGRHALQPCM